MIRSKPLAFAVATAVLAALAVASLIVGSRALGLDEVWQAVAVRASGDAFDIIWTLRLPRTAVAIAAGAALGLAGALVQALTRNPLADPGILGVNAGAALAVAVGFGTFGLTRASEYVWLAVGGALVTSLVVALAGSGRRDGDPLRLVLAGTALGAVLIGITSGLMLRAPAIFDELRAWSAGSVEGRGWDELVPVVPLVVVGVGLALAVAGPLNTLALGDDTARALGVRVGLIRSAAVAAIAALAGCATALIGPVAFVGLVVPHLARLVTGPDHRQSFVLSTLLAAALLLAADIVGRLVVRPGEMPAGIVVALIGAPIVIALVRRRSALQC